MCSPFIRLWSCHGRIDSTLIRHWFGFDDSRCRLECALRPKCISHSNTRDRVSFRLPQSPWSALMSMRSSLPHGFFFKSSVVSVSNGSVFVCFRPSCIPLPLSEWKAPGTFAVSFVTISSFLMLVLAGASNWLPAAGLIVLCRSDAANLRIYQIGRSILFKRCSPFYPEMLLPSQLVLLQHLRHCLLDWSELASYLEAHRQCPPLQYPAG